jgi:hypothetical protein
MQTSLHTLNEQNEHGIMNLTSLPRICARVCVDEQGVHLAGHVSTPQSPPPRAHKRVSMHASRSHCCTSVKVCVWVIQLARECFTHAHPLLYKACVWVGCWPKLHMCAQREDVHKPPNWYIVHNCGL